MTSRLRRVLRVVHRVWLTAGTVSFVGFVAWALLAYRANGEARRAMLSDAGVEIVQADTYWTFTPAGVHAERPALLFFPGALVDPIAYAPLIRRVAQRGFPAVLVRVPRRAAFGGAEGPEPIARARDGMRAIGATEWVVAGHSRGAEIAARMLLQSPAGLRALVLIGSSHPRDISLAHLTLPVTRVYGTRDTVADVDKVEATRPNLPASARSIRIDGGNHSQFGYYGFQPGDWPATISRDAQQAATLAALLDALNAVRLESGDAGATASGKGHAIH